MSIEPSCGDAAIELPAEKKIMMDRFVEQIARWIDLDVQSSYGSFKAIQWDVRACVLLETLRKHGIAACEENDGGISVWKPATNESRHPGVFSHGLPPVGLDRSRGDSIDDACTKYESSVAAVCRTSLAHIVSRTAIGFEAFSVGNTKIDGFTDGLFRWKLTKPGRRNARIF